MYGEGTYNHGEVVTEPNACEVCVCFYGEIHCQEPKCAPVSPGCHRVRDIPGSCCGRIFCGEYLYLRKFDSYREQII